MDGSPGAARTTEISRSTPTTGEYIPPISPPLPQPAQVELHSFQIALVPDTTRSWCTSAEPSALRADSVHVWRVCTRSIDSWTGALEVLSSDERVRASGFHFDRDRRQFVLARASLRFILARYLQCAPREIQFGYERYGKPYLSGPFKEWRHTFNLSHSGDLVLCAVALSRRVGIDVEHVRPLQDAPRLVQRFFSARERAALRGLSGWELERHFYTCWTRKEAYIKAVGKGLSCPLDGFHVSVSPAAPARLLWVSDNAEAPREWGMSHLEVGPGYAAALAVEGQNWKLERLRFDAQTLQSARKYSPHVLAAE